MGWELAPQVGLEPTTRALTVRCSTIELLRNRKVVALLYRRHTEFRQLCARLVGILEMDGLHPGVAGGLGVGGDVVEKNRAGGSEAGRAQRLLEDRGVGFQQANLVREHVRVEVLQKRVMLEDVVHVDGVGVREEQTRQAVLERFGQCDHRFDGREDVGPEQRELLVCAIEGQIFGDGAEEPQLRHFAERQFGHVRRAARVLLNLLPRLARARGEAFYGARLVERQQHVAQIKNDRIDPVHSFCKVSSATRPASAIVAPKETNPCWRMMTSLCPSSTCKISATNSAVPYGCSRAVTGRPSRSASASSFSLSTWNTAATSSPAA